MKAHHPGPTVTLIIPQPSLSLSLFLPLTGFILFLLLNSIFSTLCGCMAQLCYETGPVVSAEPAVNAELVVSAGATVSAEPVGSAGAAVQGQQSVQSLWLLQSQPLCSVFTY